MEYDLLRGTFNKTLLDIKQHIKFKQFGFIIYTQHGYKTFPYINIHECHYDISKRCIYVCFENDNENFTILCSAEEGNWFLENYMSHGDSFAELTLKQRICALEDKLKVLTEMMDKRGM